MRNLFIVMVWVVVSMMWACGGDEPEPEPTDHGKIIVTFHHQVAGELLVIDTMIYTNAAGNHYLITEVQYFISDVIFHQSDGSHFLIDDWEDMHYVDHDLPSTMTWEVFDKIPPGSYDSISFMFGISPEKNISLMFVNPPERDMFWPDVLGGGYHYLKLNGKWLNDGMAQNVPFEFHLGIGQIYSGDTINVNDITGFVHNNFRVTLPGSSFQMAAGDTLHAAVSMNIEHWFTDPHPIDLSTFPFNIMQCQECMRIGCENGKEGVFTILISKSKTQKSNVKINF
ncbi:MAG TPA: hypothetical protein PKI34_08540 [Bacteroidales bacterium]|nr:hypothetical protein [Bacteroidales bacterium]